MKLIVGAWLAMAVLVTAAPALAHDNTGDSIAVNIDEQRVIVVALVPFAELGYRDESGDGLIDAAELADQEAAIAPTIVESVREKAQLVVDGQDVVIIGAGADVATPTGEASGDEASAEVASPYVQLVFATGPHDGDVSDVSMEWSFGSPSRQVVLSQETGAVVASLSDDGTVDFSLSTRATLASFFGLGIEHIQFGLDHLLFLVVLTLTVAGASLSKGVAWRAVKLVTAFTIGHGVSLCLAYFGLVSVPAGLVEPAISLSIVGAAILAIRGQASEARPWIAALIGLIHGLGFASSLSSLGVATEHQAPALAAFNFGIDVAQTVVVLVVLAALWAFSQVLTDKMVWVRVPSAAIAGAIGLFWTVSRLASVA